MQLNREWIERCIPHRGRMCLLDEVLQWDSQRILCRSSTHRAADHPLRTHGRLGAASGIEYAAQAMAVHGALLAGAGTPRSNATHGCGTTRANASIDVTPANTTPRDTSSDGTFDDPHVNGTAPDSAANDGATQGRDTPLDNTFGNPTSGDASGNGTPAAGFLAGVRSLHLYVVLLDDVPGDLFCDVVRVAGDARSALYDFEVRSTAVCLLRGRATVILDATEQFRP